MKTRRRSSVIPSLNTDSTGQAYKSDPSEEQKQCVETDILSHLEVLAIYYFHSAALQCLSACTTITSCVMVVVDTYAADSANSYIRHSEMFFYVYFLVEFILSLVISPSKLKYLCGTEGVVDMASMVPMVTLFGSATGPKLLLQVFWFCRIARLIRMLRLFRVLQLQRKRPHTEDNADDFIRLQVANLALTILTVLFISTGLVYSLVDEDPSSFSSDHKLYWHDCFYFIVVTICTVGYGDIAPVTPATRMLVAVIIIGSFTVLPFQVGMLIDRLVSRPKYAGSLAKGKREHVVVCGKLSASKFHQFCEEILHPDHVTTQHQELLELLVLLLAPTEPAWEMRNFMDHPIYAANVRYLVGSPRSPHDLKRAKVESSLAVFVFFDGAASVEDAEDSLVLSGLSISRYVHRMCESEKKRPLAIMSCRSVKTASTLLEEGIDIAFCSDWFKHTVLAHALMFPGFPALISSLMRSNSLLGSSDLRIDQDWIRECVYSSLFEVYAIRMQSTSSALAYAGGSFAEMALALYELSVGRVMLVAVVRNKRVLFAPCFSKLSGCSHLYFVATDLQAIFATLEHPQLPQMLVVSKAAAVDEARPLPRLLRAPDCMNITAARAEQEISDDEDEVYRVTPTPDGHYSEDNESMDTTNVDSSDNLWDTSEPRPHNSIRNTDRSPLQLREHIVCCLCSKHMELSTLLHLLRPLRKRTMDAIVLLGICIGPLSQTIGDGLAAEPSLFQNVVLVQGSPRSRSLLRYAAVEKAKSVLVFSPSIENPSVDEDVDRAVLLTVLAVHNLLQQSAVPEKFKHKQAVFNSAYKTVVLVALWREDNIFFIPVTDSEALRERGKSDYFGAASALQLFAAGRVYAELATDILIVQVFYAPELLSFWLALLGDSKEHRRLISRKTTSTPASRMGKDVSRQEDAGWIDKIKCLPEFVDKPFRSLFVACVQRNMLPIALVRRPHSNGNALPYVLVNPHPDSMLCSGDELFVLLHREIFDKEPERSFSVRHVDHELEKRTSSRSPLNATRRATTGSVSEVGRRRHPGAELRDKDAEASHRWGRRSVPAAHEQREQLKN